MGGRARVRRGATQKLLTTPTHTTPGAAHLASTPAHSPPSSTMMLAQVSAVEKDEGARITSLSYSFSIALFYIVIVSPNHVQETAGLDIR